MKIGASAYVIDANVWVSYFVPADLHHRPSHDWVEAATDRGQLMLAPSLLLPEVVGAIARRTHPALGEEAHSLLAELPNLNLIPVDNELAGRAAGLAARLQLRGADAVYLAVAEWLDLPLVTWDGALRERGPVVVAVSTPTEALETP